MFYTEGAPYPQPQAKCADLEAGTAVGQAVFPLTAVAPAVSGRSEPHSRFITTRAALLSGSARKRSCMPPRGAGFVLRAAVALAPLHPES
jgi:hypothetical protein